MCMSPIGSIIRIQKFSSTGVYLTEWGGAGTGNGQFNRPSGIAIDNSGNIYVSDQNNSRVQKFGDCSSPTPTITPTFTITRTSTPTFSATVTLTASPANTNTLTTTRTSTPVIMATCTFTPTPVDTNSPTVTPTMTPYPAGDMHVFPNPSGINSAGYVKFENLPSGSVVCIYTLSGESVACFNPETPALLWKCRNNYGNIVSPGVYYYIVKWNDGREHATGKIFLTR